MSTFSPNLRIELITDGDQAGTWGNTTNTNLGTLIEDAISGFEVVSVIATNQALTALDGAADQSRNMMLEITTTTGAAFNVYAPPVPKLYTIFNNSVHNLTIYSWDSSVYPGTLRPADSGTGLGYIIDPGATVSVWSDGVDFAAQTDQFDGNFFGVLTGSFATTNWAVDESAGKLVFSYSGVPKFSIDSSGNMIVTGNITAYGTP